MRLLEEMACKGETVRNHRPSLGRREEGLDIEGERGEIVRHPPALTRPILEGTSLGCAFLWYTRFEKIADGVLLASWRHPPSFLCALMKTLLKYSSENQLFFTKNGNDDWTEGAEERRSRGLFNPSALRQMCLVIVSPPWRLTSLRVCLSPLK